MFRITISVLALSAVVTTTAHLRSVKAAARDRATALTEISDQRRVRDLDIEFFTARVERDPQGALDLARLGALYLVRARESGSSADILRAEAAARRSLANRRERNTTGWQLLAASLVAQHRFNDALEAADSLVALQSDNLSARAQRGEILLELGRYPEADAAFQPLWLRRYEPELAARVARWAEVRGRSFAARDILRSARDRVEKEANTTREQRAWYAFRIADLALKSDAVSEASQWVDRGLAVAPEDARLIGLAAKIALAQGRFHDAVELGDSAITARLDPATLGLIADAEEALGSPAEAAGYRRAMEAAAGLQLGGFHRVWALYLLDHGGNVAQILGAVTRDIQTRPDIYGYDLLAWSYYRAGRYQDARGAIAKALRWNAEDPAIRRHAAAIQKAIDGG
ncbi:MAG: hypothetical protein ABI647_00120 [Gemmatimonadota bacterium]